MKVLLLLELCFDTTSTNDSPLKCFDFTFFAEYLDRLRISKWIVFESRWVPSIALNLSCLGINSRSCSFWPPHNLKAPGLIYKQAFLEILVLSIIWYKSLKYDFARVQPPRTMKKQTASLKCFVAFFFVSLNIVQPSCRHQPIDNQFRKWTSFPPPSFMSSKAPRWEKKCLPCTVCTPTLH